MPTQLANRGIHHPRAGTLNTPQGRQHKAITRIPHRGTLIHQGQKTNMDYRLQVLQYIYWLRRVGSILKEQIQYLYKTILVIGAPSGKRLRETILFAGLFKQFGCFHPDKVSAVRLREPVQIIYERHLIIGPPGIHKQIIYKLSCIVILTMFYQLYYLSQCGNISLQVFRFLISSPGACPRGIVALKVFYKCLWIS